MKIQLSEHFTYKKLLRFVLPSIIMMIFTSIYSVVDGLFVSNFVGKTALAAIQEAAQLLPGCLEKKREKRQMNIFPCSSM